MAEAVRAVLDEFPSQGIVYDISRLPLDCTGWEWRLNNPVSSCTLLMFRRLNFRSTSLLASTARYLAARVQVVSSSDVFNAFQTLIFLQHSRHFRDCEASGAPLDEKLFADLRLLSNFADWRLHYVRAWYRWCAERREPQFSREVADRLEEISIGGNEKGRAVRTRDPEQGAYDELEFLALTTRLRSGEASKDLTLAERALVWLAIALGRNSIAYALMREEDYRPLVEKRTGRVLHRFNVPRAKKGDDEFRGDFKEEMLNDEIGELVAKLIEENKTNRANVPWEEGCAFPLFVRRNVREGDIGKPRHEYAMHLRAGEIAIMLKNAVAKLDIVSHRTGEPLIVNPRRFRRTFGTRGAEEGASPVELATMLDHSDTQSVGVYFETRSSIVKRLDAALAVTLGPIADAFMGRLVETEADAVNGGDPAKRIPWFKRVPGRAPESAGNLGTCGSGPCSLFAPLSCYRCDKFQPWKDGPHREVLDWLCAERDRKQKDGLDPQIVGLHDGTIMAVGEVVRRCEESAP